LLKITQRNKKLSNQKMNLHLMPDDKFLDDFIDIAESVDKFNNNTYVAYRAHFTDKLKYINNEKVIVAKYKSQEFINAIGDLGKYDKIFIHFFSEEMWDFVLTVPPQKKIYWLFWGGDFYYPPEYFDKFLFDTKTRKYFKDKQAAFYQPKSFLKKLIGTVRRPWRIYKNTLFKGRAIGRIDYFCHFNILD